LNKDLKELWKSIRNDRKKCNYFDWKCQKQAKAVLGMNSIINYGLKQKQKDLKEEREKSK
jgi:hypothetical protein